MSVKNNRRKRQAKGAASRPHKRWTAAQAGSVAKRVYAGVVVLVLIGLIYVLQERDIGTAPPRDDQVVDPDVAAVLEDMRRSAPGTSIRDIENRLPPKPVEAPKPETQKEPAWMQYSAHWIAGTEAKIAIVIDDLGLSGEATEQLAAMTGPYTLAFLPYAPDLPAQTRKVRARGHELMVHLPMQPQDKAANPGTNALLANLSNTEFDRRLDWNLSQFGGFVGVNNHMGSLLTEQPDQMVRVMVHLKKGGFLFLDSLTSPKSVGIRAASAAGVPNIARDVFLDNVRKPELILEQLHKAETIARERGWAVAIGHPHPETLATLAHWRAGLAKRGVVLAPLSQLVAERDALRLHADARRSSRSE